MNLDIGKVIFSSFAEAQQAVKQMRTRHDQNFSAYKTDKGWAVGGVHMKQKKEYKRAKSLADIKSLFADIEFDSKDEKIVEYFEIISTESSANKVTTANGNENYWVLESVQILPGNELGMSNSKKYLTLIVKNENNDELRLKMGGAFEKSISLVKKQAEDLLHKPIIWHTWNSSKTNSTTWGSDSWFYLIEEA